MSSEVAASEKKFSSLLDIFSEKFARKTSLDDEMVNRLLEEIGHSLCGSDVDPACVKRLIVEVKVALAKKILSADEESLISNNRHKSDIVKTEVIKALIRLVSPPLRKKESIVTTTTTTTKKIKLGSDPNWEPKKLKRAKSHKLFYLSV